MVENSKIGRIIFFSGFGAAQDIKYHVTEDFIRYARPLIQEL